MTTGFYLGNGKEWSQCNPTDLLTKLYVRDNNDIEFCKHFLGNDPDIS